MSCCSLAILPTVILFFLFAHLSLKVNAQQLTNEILSAYIAQNYSDKSNTKNKNEEQIFSMTGWAKIGNSSSKSNETKKLNSEIIINWAKQNYLPTKKRIELSKSERKCLAQAIYHEARGEPEYGQWAVANVILNRVKSPSYPATICEVVFQNASTNNYKCQFTFACDNRPDSAGIGNRIVRLSWVKSNLIAKAAYRQFLLGESLGILPDSALFYHANTVSPSWAKVYKIVARIGNHIFYAKS